MCITLDSQNDSDDRERGPSQPSLMKGKRSPENRDRSRIEAELEGCEGAINDLATSLDRMFMRLAPILSPSQESEKDGDQDRPEMSDVAASINSLTDHVQMLQRAVSLHTRRLEI